MQLYEYIITNINPHYWNQIKYIEIISIFLLTYQLRIEIASLKKFF